MTKTSRQIELDAVNKIVDIFNGCNRLSPYIANGDKEPTWDGFVYLKNMKGVITGRVPVQVKGKVVKKVPKTPTYSVNLTDLQNYKREGGILYFVVYLKDGERIPFYAKLAGVDLKRYIKAAKGRKSISIHLKPFENNNEALEREILNFSIDQRKQTSFADSPILSLEEALKEGRKISASITGPQSKEEALKEMGKNAVYFYTEIESNGIKALYPVGDQAYKIFAARKVNQDVSINGKVYYNYFVTREDRNSVIYIIGNCMTITIEKDNNKLSKGKLDFNTETTLISQRIHELQLLSDFYLYKNIKLGQRTIKVKSVQTRQKNAVSKELLRWKNASLLFKKFNINQDVDTKSFTDKDFGNIDLLINAILENKPVKQDHELSTITTAEIGPYNVLLFAKKLGDGNYNIQDFFQASKDLQYVYEDERGNKLATSLFTIVFNRKDLANLSNVVYTDLVESYEFAAKFNPYIKNQANNDMLKALLSYDASENKDISLFNAIKSLNDWLVEKTHGKDVIHIINHYQILKRQRDLSKEEKRELFSLLNKNKMSNDKKAAIHLLLDNLSSAEYYLDKLSAKDRKFFLSLPISHFMRK